MDWDKREFLLTMEFQILLYNQLIHLKVKEEFERLKKDREKTISEIERADKKLNNKGFVDKAPKKVVDEEKEKLAKYKDMLLQIEARLKDVEVKIK